MLSSAEFNQLYKNTLYAVNRKTKASHLIIILSDNTFVLGGQRIDMDDYDQVVDYNNLVVFETALGMYLYIANTN